MWGGFVTVIVRGESTAKDAGFAGFCATDLSTEGDVCRVHLDCGRRGGLLFDAIFVGRPKTIAENIEGACLLSNPEQMRLARVVLSENIDTFLMLVRQCDVQGGFRSFESH